MADGTQTATREVELVHRSMLVREIREELREADFVCSTDATDSYGTSIDQESWVLARYATNPVVLYSHDARSRLPIGQAPNTRVEKGHLVTTVRFSKVTQLAEECWQQVLEKTLRGISVGFNPRTITFTEVDGEDVVILSDCELYELSLTPLPSNPEALARLRARAIATRDGGTAAPTTTPAKPRGGEEEPTMATEKETALEGRVAEQSTTIRTLEEKARDLETKATTAAKELETVTTRATALDEQNKLLVTERDALKSQVAIVEGEKIEREVDALVGKKFLPAERDHQVALAKKDIALFRSLAEQRSNLALTEQVVPTDQKAPPTREPDTKEAREAATQKDADAFFSSITRA